MAWVKIDDGFVRHPKFARALARDPMSLLLWLAGACHCAEHATDGLLGTEATAIVPLFTIARAQILVDVGLWIVTDAGYQYHDWLKYQISKAADEQRRESTKVRVEKYRMRNGATGSSCNAVTDDVTNEKKNAVASEGNGATSGSGSLLEEVESAQTGGKESAERKGGMMSLRAGLERLRDRCPRFVLGPPPRKDRERRNGAMEQATLGLPQWLWGQLQLRFEESDPTEEQLDHLAAWWNAGGWDFSDILTPRMLAEKPGMYDALTQSGAWDGKSPVGKQKQRHPPERTGTRNRPNWNEPSQKKKTLDEIAEELDREALERR